VGGRSRSVRLRVAVFKVGGGKIEGPRERGRCGLFCGGGCEGRVRGRFQFRHTATIFPRATGVDAGAVRVEMLPDRVRVPGGGGGTRGGRALSGVSCSG